MLFVELNVMVGLVIAAVTGSNGLELSSRSPHSEVTRTLKKAHSAYEMITMTGTESITWNVTPSASPSSQSDENNPNTSDNNVQYALTGLTGALGLASTLMLVGVVRKLYKNKKAEPPTPENTSNFTVQSNPTTTPQSIPIIPDTCTSSISNSRDASTSTTEDGRGKSGEQELSLGGFQCFEYFENWVPTWDQNVQMCDETSIKNIENENEKGGAIVKMECEEEQSEYEKCRINEEVNHEIGSIKEAPSEEIGIEAKSGNVEKLPAAGSGETGESDQKEYFAENPDQGKDVMKEEHEDDTDCRKEMTEPEIDRLTMSGDIGINMDILKGESRREENCAIERMDIYNV